MNCVKFSLFIFVVTDDFCRSSKLFAGKQTFASSSLAAWKFTSTRITQNVLNYSWERDEREKAKLSGNFEISMCELRRQSSSLEFEFSLHQFLNCIHWISDSSKQLTQWWYFCNRIPEWKIRVPRVWTNFSLGTFKLKANVEETFPRYFHGGKCVVKLYSC